MLLQLLRHFNAYLVKMCTTLASCSKLSSDLQLATSSASVEYASGRKPSMQVRLQTDKT